MTQDVQDYASALDFDANDPLLTPAPRGSLPGGTTPQESPSSATYLLAPAPETAPAPGPAPAAPRATATCANGYAMQPGATRAVIRGQVRSSAATNCRPNRNNRAALGGLFQKDTVQQVHMLGSPKLGYHANLDVAHQLDDAFSTRNAYATTNTPKRFRGGAKAENLQHLQEGYGPSTSGALESGI